MTKYLLKRILHGLVSIVIVVALVMIMIYTMLDRNLVFAGDTKYSHTSNNARVVYKYSKWEDYGYLDYITYSDWLNELVSNGELTEEERSAVVGFGRTKDADSTIWKGCGKHVIWAPHHSINDEGLRMSTFRWNYEFFLEYAKSHPDLSFILKPHPALRSVCIASGFMSEKEYDDYIREWNSLPNALVYDKGNYFDIFKTSDILVTDCSSFFGEYFPSKHPILLLERPDRAEFDELGKHLEAGFYRAKNTSEIETVLQKLLYENSDPLENKRKELISKYMYFGKKPTYETIYDFILSSSCLHFSTH